MCPLFSIKGKRVQERGTETSIDYLNSTRVTVGEVSNRFKVSKLSSDTASQA